MTEAPFTTRPWRPKAEAAEPPENEASPPC
jgi:hypothetical protein